MEESARLLIFAIGPLSDPLAQQPHPPTDARQAGANLLAFDWTTGDGVDLSLRGGHRRHIDVSAVRAKQQPPPRDLAIIPSRHDIRTRAENQMKVIRKDRETEKIDAERSGKLLQVLLDPDFAMIEVLSRDRIMAQQEATANSPIVNMNNRDLVRVNHFRSRHPNHGIAPRDSSVSNFDLIDNTAIRCSVNTS